MQTKTNVERWWCL